MANEAMDPAGPNGTEPGSANTDENGHAPERGAASLVSGIIADAQHLIGQQLLLFRQEIQHEWRQLWPAAVALGAAAFITVIGSSMLLLMVPLLLHYLVPDLPLWGCFGIVGAVLVGTAGLLAFVAVWRIRSCSPFANQAVEAFKENFTWTTRPRS